MRREVYDDLWLYAADSAWCCFDPAEDGPSIDVGSAASMEDAMRRADMWVRNNTNPQYVVNEFQAGDNGYCKVLKTCRNETSAAAFMCGNEIDQDEVARGHVAIRDHISRIEDLPWLRIMEPAVRLHLEDLDQIDQELT